LLSTVALAGPLAVARPSPGLRLVSTTDPAPPTGVTSTGVDGGLALTPSGSGRLLAVSGDLVIVTTSQALVSGDSNRVRDLYLEELASGTASSPVG
jgi:hypothetical protein